MPEAQPDARAHPGDEWAAQPAIHGLDESGLYLHLQDHHNQVRAGLAEIYIGSDLAGVRLRPGDMVTTGERVWLVDVNDRGVAPAATTPTSASLFRVYRRFATPARRPRLLPTAAARCRRLMGRPGRRQRSP